LVINFVLIKISSLFQAQIYLSIDKQNLNQIIKENYWFESVLRKIYG